MKRSENYFTKTIFTLLLSLSVLTTACNNPAGDDNDEEHHEPAGAVLKMNGEEIARYDNGEITGQIEVNSGEETALITIFFLAGDGDEFQPDDPENSLNWKDLDESVAEVEKHEEDGKWSFHIHGIETGETSVVFQLFHDDDHSDFDTKAFPIIVN